MVNIKRLLLLIFPAFIIFSFVFTNRSLTSANLTVVTVRDGEISTTSYVDLTNAVHFASDKGYASKRITYQDGRNVMEEYLDEQNNPVTLSSGYSKIQRIYKDGENTEIKYLNASGDPVTIKSGYDMIKRLYDSSSLTETDTYYRNGNQIQRTEGYWQYKRFYNGKKQAIELQYLDKDGNLTLHKNGYAIIRRSYNDAGNVERERYYGMDGQPTTSTLGQYGFHREYDDEGRAVRTTYLDASGQPENTKNGYAIEERRYEGTGIKRLYFDKDGSPVTIGRSQYGILKSGGQNVYLNDDGEIMYRLDNILNTHPWIIPVAGAILAAAAVMLRGKVWTVFLVAYCLFILYMTIIYRETGESRGEFELFRSYREFFRNPMTRQNILNNIWLFMPLGVLLYAPYHPSRLLWAAGLSVLIEFAQWSMGTGLAELDDIVSNFLGALIGYGFAAGVDALRGKLICRSRKQTD